MGMRIKTNIASLNAQRKLGESTQQLNESMTRLASGERINRAADDAAGLSISENQKSAMRSLSMAKRNANDGVSLVQTAEGGLLETNNMLVRLRELAVQAASDTISDRERAYLNQEFLQIKDEIDRIAMSTEYNGTRLLVGDSELPSDIKRGQNSFPLEIQVNKNYYEISDKIEEKNPLNIIKVDFTKLNSFTSGDYSLKIGKGEEGAQVGDKTRAQLSLAMLDGAVDSVNEKRSYLGSIQNRLMSTISSLDVQIENVTDAKGRIRDTDFAVETAKLTQATILQKAGLSVLSQANAAPTAALALLQV